MVDRVDRRLRPYWNHPVWLDHPPTAVNQPRYGYGRPRHPGLDALLTEGRATYRAELQELSLFGDDLLRIPVRGSSRPAPQWINDYLLGLDTVSLYGYTRRSKPSRYLEIGSGYSTLVVDRARQDGSLTTEIVSIDPRPRTAVDAVCDHIVRQPLELADLELFQDLAAGDMLFVDGSHRLFMNSDMVTFYLDVLPRLPSGVLVGIHDVLWPDDYLPEWSEFWFSDQYLLAAYLLAGAPWIRPLLACNYVAQDPELSAILSPIWNDPRLAAVDRRGFSFWFQVDRH